MARPTCKRRISFQPKAVYFKPAGIPMSEMQEIVIHRDEVEAMRLKNLLGFPQEEAATQMGVSQPTFHRLINAAHQKVTDAIINGKALRIEGGNVSVHAEITRPCRWRKGWGQGCASADAAADAAQSITENTEKRDSMKIAVTSADGAFDGMVDERFGRANKLIVVDAGTDAQEIIDNTGNMGASQGAGIRTAQNAINAGVKAVISGHLGPNAFHVLSSAGIEVFTATNMTGREALDSYKKGELSRLAGSDVDGHW